MGADRAPSTARSTADKSVSGDSRDAASTAPYLARRPGRHAERGRQRVAVGEPVGYLLGLGAGEELPERGFNGSEEAKSLPGRSSRNRRSRNRLARSQEVSDAMTQQWQAAPWRKSSGSRGVRLAQIGSEEHRAAR